VRCTTPIAALGTLLLFACGSDGLDPGEGYLSIDDETRLYYHTVGSGPDTVVVPAAMYLARDLESLAPGRTLVFYYAWPGAVRSRSRRNEAWHRV
jgi:hypothetical protein